MDADDSAQAGLPGSAGGGCAIAPAAGDNPLGMIDTDTELFERVRDLREQGRSPKEIARGLRLPPSKIRPLVQAVAAERPSPKPGVVGCWVSAGWSYGLGVEGQADWLRLGTSGVGLTGLVCALVAWEHRYDQVLCCTYLLDVWCLGVKDTIGPRKMDAAELTAFRSMCFGGYEQDPLPAPLELVQHLVWGSVDFARSLGFDPHPDFAVTSRHLDRPAGPCPITFGNAGKPDYVAGPFDDSGRVMRALARSAGTGNFHFTVPLG